MFGAAWNGRKYSIKSAAALRAFIRVAPDVVRRLDQEHADRTDFRAIGRVICPVGPPHRRPAVRDGRGLETRGDDGGLAVEGAAARAAVSRGHVGLDDWKSGHVGIGDLGFQMPSITRLPNSQKKRGAVFSGAPANLQTTRLPSNSRLPAVNIQAVCTTLLSKGRTADFPSDFAGSCLEPSDRNRQSDYSFGYGRFCWRFQRSWAPVSSSATRVRPQVRPRSDAVV